MLTADYSIAPIAYTIKGQEIRQRLWEENMEEFRFVSAEEIVKGVRQ